VSESSRRGLFWVLALAVLVVAGVAYWYFHASGPAKSAAGAVGRHGMAAGMTTPVSVATVRQGRIGFSLKAIGTVTAINTVTVRSRVDGELEHMYFKEGQKVHAGDLLAQIDPRTYQIQLDQALGAQKQNQALLQNAQRDLKRYQLLYKQNSVAKQLLDAQESLVRQYQGAQKSDQAAVDNAKLQLGFTRIVAPITGIVGLRQVDPGNLISASSTDGLAVITQMQPISVIFALPQSQLPAVLAQVRAHKTLAVDLYGRDDTQVIATGQLVSVDNQIDVQTGTVKLRARFPNTDETLFPNEFVNVLLHVSTDDSAIVIPSGAVQQGSIGAFVYVVAAGDKAHVQPIKTGTVDGDNIAVLSGLSPGQKVVTEGVDRLREGSPVQIIAPKPAADSAAAPAKASAGGGSALPAPGPAAQSAH